MKIKTFTIVIALCIGSTLNAFAQDPHFTQFFSNPIYLNPAYAGTTGGSRIATNYRNQWSKPTENYVTYSASYDQPINFLSGGVGIHFMSDYAGSGTIINNTINASYAYNLNLGKNLHIRPALNFGYGKKRIDASKITEYDPVTHNDVPLMLEHDSKEYFNLGIGFLVAYKKLAFGFSIDHLNEPIEGILSESKLSKKITIHTNYQFDITEKTKLISGLILQQQMIFQNIQPSLLLKIDHFKLGASYRFDPIDFDCIIGMIGYGNKWVNIGYSYDFTVSKLTNVAGGTHEISAIFMFNHKEKNEKQKIVPFEGF
jgi:type IX secretion system PorP/SprF family membrane protein